MKGTSLLWKAVAFVVLYVVPLAVVAFAGLATVFMAFFYPREAAVNIVEGDAESAEWGPWEEGAFKDETMFPHILNMGFHQPSYFAGTKDDPLPSTEDRYCGRVGTVTTAWHVMPVRFIRFWGAEDLIVVAVYSTGPIQYRRGRITKDISIDALELFGGWFLWVVLLRKFVFKKAPAIEAGGCDGPVGDDGVSRAG